MFIQTWITSLCASRNGDAYCVSVESLHGVDHGRKIPAFADLSDGSKNAWTAAHKTGSSIPSRCSFSRS